RDAVRTFRLSRIGDDVQTVGPVGAVHKPDDIDVRAVADEILGADHDVVTGEAQVWVAAGRAQEIRRLGEQVAHRELGGREGDVIAVPIRSWEWMARVVAGHGADAVAQEPAEFRQRVVEILQAHAGERNGEAV
ncbi:MAG: WYL domain-containing protein, partial [Rhodococcus sp.]|nr:WYL domain-containing protein [Rhodococcus sp. (in: high G+C Gram-positive bacteria)]